MEEVDVTKLSFEEALEQLEQLVDTIDAGELPLAEAINAFKLANALREHCATLLEEAEAAIEELATDDRGVTSAAEEADEMVDDASFAELDEEAEESFENPFGD